MDEDLAFGRLSEEELISVGNSLLRSIGPFTCPRCGTSEVRLESFESQKGLGLIPRSCCADASMSLWPSYLDAWLTLDPGARPVLPLELTIGLLEEPGMDALGQAEVRQAYVQLFRESLSRFRCRHHAGETRLIVELSYSGSRQSVVTFIDACCKEFECCARLQIFELNSGEVGNPGA